MIDRPVSFEPRAITPPPVPARAWNCASLAIDLSGRCNLRCRYCAESALQPERPPMAPEVLDEAWEWFRAQRPATWSVHLGSGEPLLARPLIERLETKLREDDPAGLMPAIVTTNGTLIGRDAARWLATSPWQVKVSLDGPEEVHDRFRVTPDGSGTHARVLGATRALAARLGSRLAVSAVLCRGTDPAAVVAAVAAAGISHMELNPVVSADPALVPDAADLARYEAFIRDYARRWSDSATGLEPVLGRFARYVTRVMGYDTRRFPCGAGRDFLGVGPDGTLYPCMRYVGVPRFALGSVPSGVDPEAAIEFQRGAGRPWDERESCRDCWAAPLCGGPCFACDGFDTSHHCEIHRAEAAAAVWLVDELRARAPERLLSFLHVRLA